MMWDMKIYDETYYRTNTHYTENTAHIFTLNHRDTCLLQLELNCRMLERKKEQRQKQKLDSEQ